MGLAASWESFSFPGHGGKDGCPGSYFAGSSAGVHTGSPVAFAIWVFR